MSTQRTAWHPPFSALLAEGHTGATQDAAGSPAAPLRPEDLTLVLAVPDLTPTLPDEVEAVGRMARASETGYHCATAGPYCATSPRG